MTQRDLFDKFDNTEWRIRYRQVLQSKRWRELRNALIAKTGGTCQRCGWCSQRGNKSRRLELHHRNYERLGQERASDIELLCSSCHIQADVERAAIAREVSAQALEDARFAGWASSVYGDDWEHFESEEMHERYEIWEPEDDR